MLSSCSNGINANAANDVLSGKAELSAFTNNSALDEYDSKYFYRNDLKNFGGDAGVIYVSKEQSPEYGGYYYLYHSSNDNMYIDDRGDHKSAIPVVRSTDLNSWEVCGAVDNGFSLYIDNATDWIDACTWAPEVIFDPTSKKYFMYLNATSIVNPDYKNGTDYDTEYKTYHYEGNTGNSWDRMYLAIAISDTPVGPFRLATSENYYGDANTPNLNGEIIDTLNPQIDVKYHFKLAKGEYFGIIDASPFFDDDGTLYLYFSRHVTTNHTYQCNWGIRMKDMITPDYDSLTLLIFPNYKKVTKIENKWKDAPWDEASYNLEEPYNAPEYTNQMSTDGYKWEGNGVEGPYAQVVDDGNGGRRYLLMYSARGYADKYYDTSQCYSESPLGPFYKPPLRPSAIIGANDNNDFMTGCGHSAIIQSPEGDYYCYYWVQGNPDDTSTCAWKGWSEQGAGRVGAFDRIYLVDTEYGRLFYGNGPTKSLQPKLQEVSGYTNVASKASVKVSNLESGKEYINDGLFVSHEYYKDWETTTKGATEITLTFDEPQTIGAVMVYNSYDYHYAFSSVDSIEFELASKPTWWTQTKYYKNMVVNNIAFSSDFIGSSCMRQGGSCLASFNDITVNKITIKISQKIDSSVNEIKISDVTVLGK